MMKCTPRFFCCFFFTFFFSTNLFIEKCTNYNIQIVGGKGGGGGGGVGIGIWVRKAVPDACIKEFMCVKACV